MLMDMFIHMYIIIYESTRNSRFAISEWASADKRLPNKFRVLKSQGNGTARIWLTASDTLPAKFNKSRKPLYLHENVHIFVFSDLWFQQFFIVF